MRIIHRFSDNINPLKQWQLRKLGVEVGTGFVAFEVDEANSSFKAIQKLALKWKAVDLVRTEFTKAELSNAKVLEMGVNWLHGYPQPEEDFGYLQVTYSAKSLCDLCGSGRVQKYPFRMKQEPNWGTKKILQLNWVFDEYFVQPGTWKKVFEPFGIACREVLHFRTGKPLKSVVQLCIDKISKSALSMDDSAKFETCTKCGIRKYKAIARGEFPYLPSKSKFSIIKTKEVFGSGLSSWRAVLVSSELFQAITNAKLKGVQFYPCAMK